MSDLFPEAVQDSPKLAWLKKHGLKTKHDLHPVVLGTEWKCCNIAETMASYAPEEGEAILLYCECFQLTHWTLEDAR